jgi:probable F420-dependent oxidoreductase
VTALKFNYQLPPRAVKRWDEWIGTHRLADIAVAAEDANFDLVSMTDHPFPYEPWLRAGGHHAFDPFISLSFMAAATRRIKVCTLVVVAAYRNPYVTAKAAASLDNLSGGRLVLGMGAGYQKEEFDVLGASFADRGKRFDSAVRAMQAAWSGDVLDHEDEFFPAHGHVMLPLPSQRPGPPIWFGGNSPAARRRVVSLGNGWMPFEQSEQAAQITGTPALTSVDELATQIGELRQRARDAGREDEIAVCFGAHGKGGVDAHAESLAARMDAFVSAGLTHVLVDSQARSFDECIREIDLYAKLTNAA